MKFQNILFRFFVISATLLTGYHTFGQTIVSNPKLISGSGNSFPFNSPTYANKVELCYGSNDWATMPARCNITKIYFRFTSTVNATYSKLSVSLAQLPAADITTTKQFTSPVTNVYGPANTTIFTANSGVWFGITLDRSFYFDPAKVLIVVVSHHGYTGSGGSLSFLTGSDLSRYRIFGNADSANGIGNDLTKYDFGFDYEPTIVNNAGIDAMTSPVTFCTNKDPKDISVRVKNYGSNDLNTVKIGWTFNDTVQNPVLWNYTIPIGHDTIVTLGQKHLVTLNNYQLKAWTEYPNFAVDSAPQDDTLKFSFTAKIDVTPPFITLKGANPDSVEVTTIFKSTSYKDPDISFSDDYTSTSQIALARSGSFYNHFPGGLKPDATGIYNITYTATDQCGNRASKNRIVKVRDYTPPVISLKGPLVVSVCRWADYKDSGFVVSDNYDSLQNIRIDTFGSYISNGRTAMPGTVFLRYKATDRSGNSSISPGHRDIIILPNDDFGCKSGIVGSDSKHAAVLVYPNPGHDKFQIRLLNTVREISLLKITDMYGREKEVCQPDFSGQNSMEINLSDLPAGMYFIRVYTGGAVSILKIELIK
jgi:hypothetical protein